MNRNELIKLLDKDEPIELNFAEMHTAQFVAGTNLGLKLDPSRRSGLELFYYKGFLFVTWNGITSFTDAMNAANMIPGKPKAKLAQISHPMTAGVPTTAQVETPYGHVHAGPGKGKTGK